MKKPLCCIIGYDTKDGTTWKATILAYSVKEALEYLYTQVKGKIRVNTTEGSREIDAFHPTIKKDFLTENVVEEREVEVEVEVVKEVYVDVIKEIEVPVEVEVIKEVIKEVEVEVPVDNGIAKLICPWCEKEFVKPLTLKTHCIKYHLKDAIE